MTVYATVKTMLAAQGVALTDVLKTPPCWALVYGCRGRDIDYKLTYYFGADKRATMLAALEIADTAYRALLALDTLSDLAMSEPKGIQDGLACIDITWTGGRACL